jgi:hypothetical protein
MRMPSSGLRLSGGATSVAFGQTTFSPDTTVSVQTQPSEVVGMALLSDFDLQKTWVSLKGGSCF